MTTPQIRLHFVVLS